MNIVKIEAQHDFPNDDLTNANAELLELLMQNREIIDASHKSAEGISILFRLGHTSLLKIADARLNDADHLRALSHGITTYEALSGMMMRPDDSETDEASIALQVITAQTELEHDFMGVLTDARGRFQDELPRTNSVIGASAARFCRYGSDYALFGAAIARQLEVDARS